MNSEHASVLLCMWSLGIYSIQAKVNCDDVTSVHCRTCAKMEVRGASFYLSRELITDWSEYLSYCKCCSVSLHQLKNDDESLRSHPL